MRSTDYRAWRTGEFDHEHDHDHNQPRAAVLRPLEVEVWNNDPGSFHKALKRFKRKVSTEGVMRELKKRRFYVKPGDRRRNKKKAADRRRKKAARRG